MAGAYLYNTNKKTVRGVYINIQDSDICSLRNGLYFYFCSTAIKEHFEKHIDKYIEKAKARIQSVVPNVDITNIDLALTIEYYTYIEKRGFRVETLHGAKIKKAHLLGDVEFVEEKEE